MTLSSNSQSQVRVRGGGGGGISERTTYYPYNQNTIIKK